MRELTNKVFDIAFVTVNYNTRALVEDMLIFFERTPLPFSHVLVIVDNNSVDGSREILTGQNSAVYISSEENLGYGRAINRGVQAVKSNYICALNTDVLLSVESLTALWDFMERHPDAGVVSPRITNKDGSTQGFIFHKSILSAMFNVLNRLRTSLLKRMVVRASTPLRVQGVLGAFFLIRRSLVPDGKLFDENFFFYYEDTDLAHRLYELKIPCFVLPSCSLVHLGGTSTSIEGARIFYKSKGIYLTKHYGVGFANIVRRLDCLRLRMKFLKYSLLAILFSSRRIAEKRSFYAAMRQASDVEVKRV